MTWQVRLGVALIQAYQLALGPFTGGGCRFHPSCSAYAIEAVKAHGPVRGWLLALGRIARCHPWARPGIDPVPPVTGSR